MEIQEYQLADARGQHRMNRYLPWALFFSGIYMVLGGYLKADTARFPDLLNYGRSFNDFSLYGWYYDFGGLSLIFSEPVWGLIVLVASVYLDDPELLYFCVSLISILVIATFVLVHSNSPALLIFLLNPLIIDLVFSQIRSALALSLLLCAVMHSKGRLVGVILVTLACLIHTSMIVLIGIYVAAKLISRIRMPSGSLIRFGMVLFVALVVALVLSFGREALLTGVEDRRAIYLNSSSSIMYLGFWSCAALILLFSRLITGVYKSSWMVFFVAIFFFTSFFMGLAGVNGTRFVSLSIPLFIVTISFCEPRRRLPLFSSLFGFQLIQYAYWV